MSPLKYENDKDEQKQDSIVVYTAIINEYDTLRDPLKPTPGYKYVCFTNSKKEVQSNIWKIVKTSTSATSPLSPTKAARFIKTHPHRFFSRADIAIWCDANILMKGDISSLVSEFNETGANFSAITHPHRSCTYEEAETCKRLKKDNLQVIDKQMARYTSEGFLNGLGLVETGFFIVNLKHENTKKAFQFWWEEIEKGSHRDQLSVMYAFKKADEPIVPFLFSVNSKVSVRNHPLFSHFRHGEAPEEDKPHQKKKLSTSQGSHPTQVLYHATPKGECAIDILICVHNAVADLERCVNSLKKADLSKVNKFIVINDHSNYQTTRFIRRFGREESSRFIYYENMQHGPLGYTRAANVGLGLVEADGVILLNSDTILPAKALSKLHAVLFHYLPNCGIVGPLSNAAGPQSIPYTKKSANNSAINTLPKNISIEQLDAQCEAWAGTQPTFPVVPLIHGFCMGIKKEVISDIGVFDKKHFPKGYGEENDYCIRSLRAGYVAVVATNIFVYHAKSKSYINTPNREALKKTAAMALTKLYGAKWIELHKETINHPELVRIRTEAHNFWKEHNGNANRRSSQINTLSRVNPHRTGRKPGF